MACPGGMCGQCVVLCSGGILSFEDACYGAVSAPRPGSQHD